MKIRRFFSLILLPLGASILSCDRAGKSSRQDLPRIHAIAARHQKGDFDYAALACEEYTREYPGCEVGWHQLGWSRLHFRSFNDAAYCFGQAIAIDPRHDNSYVGLGVVRRGEGDFQGARDAYMWLWRSS